MAKLASALDIKHVGDEPILQKGCSESDLAIALNWYNYVCASSDAKEFVISYLKSVKYDKNDIKKLNKAKLPNSVGWMCRIIMQGGSLPDDYEDRMWEKIKTAIKNAEPDDVIEDQPQVKVVVSIQERVRDKTAELIGDLENQLDVFFENGKLSFDPAAWIRQKDIKPAISQKIAEYYKPLYSELFDALQGKDLELKEAYSHWKKPQLRAYVELVKSIISAAEGRATVAKIARKPRKKKAVPVTTIVSKIKYKEEDKDFGIVSVKPTDIVGCQQLWVFNTKYRTLAVYNAMSTTGLTVKGTTLIGFDEKTSVIKKLRKPNEQLALLIKAGKVNLRKFMDSIKCKPKEATGRLNTDTVLVRIIK
jgi:hypothetical protein